MKSTIKLQDMDLQMRRFGLYCNSLERFLLVKDDLWLVLHSAKLLSSKLSSCVCPIYDEDMNNENCYTYGLVKPSEAKQNVQMPQYVSITSGEELKGPPADIELEMLNQHKKFINYLFLVVQASWIADAELNDSDHYNFASLITDNEFVLENDNSGLENGFKKSIDKILYTANTVDEIKKRVKSIMDYKTTSRPTMLAQYEKILFKNIENG